MSVTDEFRDEVARGERFRFGRNWALFLRKLNEERVRIAENSLVQMLGLSSLKGMSFIDIGSGSGLFSLVARRLGAKVHSFDYDPQSFACTQELRRRYFPNDPDWTVERGSVLNTQYLSKLGTFDIVYSWGVLHHTGRMWEALDNIKPLSRVGGLLYIAIYNDLGAVTDTWEKIKRTYNSLPWPLNSLYVAGSVIRRERGAIKGAWRDKQLGPWIRSWTHYQHVSTRGMSRWRDEIDWYGGLPYERASVEAIVEVYARDGFRIQKIADNSLGYGCNEFVFGREAEASHFVDAPIPGGLSIISRFGKRLLGPFETIDGHRHARLGPLPDLPDDAELLIFRDGRLIEVQSAGQLGSIPIASAEEGQSSLDSSKFYVVAARRLPMPDEKFLPAGGFAWRWPTKECASFADDTREDRKGSPVFVIEQDSQLPWPSSQHDDIRLIGTGRYSHWQDEVMFSTLHNIDPNDIKPTLSLFCALRLS